MSDSIETLPLRFLHAIPLAGVSVHHAGDAIDVQYVAGDNRLYLCPNQYSDVSFDPLRAADLRIDIETDHALTLRLSMRSNAWQASHVEWWQDVSLEAGRGEATLDLRDFRLAQNAGEADVLALAFTAPAAGTFRIRNLRFSWQDGPTFFAPRVDRWGQRLRGDWPGKVHNDADLRHDAARPLPPPAATLDAYAVPARLPVRFEGTGFFRLEAADGVHWLVTPEGRPFLSTGPCCVSYGPIRTSIRGREELFAELPDRAGPLHEAWQKTTGRVFAEIHPAAAFGNSPESTIINFPVANLIRKYGPDWRAAWEARTRARLLHWGMNTCACWSDIEFAQAARLPYLLPADRESDVDWGPLRHTGRGPFPLRQTPDVFHPEFESRSEHWFDHLSAYRDDSYLLGYFVNNEEKWCAWHSPFALPTQWASRRVFVDELQSRYGDIDGLNTAWKSRFASFDHLFHFVQARNPPGLSDQGVRDCDDFMRRFADRYFARLRDRLRAADPNHLYWGCRFLALPPRPCLLDGMAPHMDICSINWYLWHKQTLADIPAFLGEWHRAIGNRPLAITEYSFEVTDARGLASRLLVTDAAERIRLAAGFTRGCLALPYVVGMHWFQMIDQPITGRTLGDGERANFGLIDVADRPYADLTAALAEVFRRMYDEHGTG